MHGMHDMREENECQLWNANLTPLLSPFSTPPFPIPPLSAHTGLGSPSPDSLISIFILYHSITYIYHTYLHISIIHLFNDSHNECYHMISHEHVHIHIHIQHWYHTVHGWTVCLTRLDSIWWDENGSSPLLPWLNGRHIILYYIMTWHGMAWYDMRWSILQEPIATY